MKKLFLLAGIFLLAVMTGCGVKPLPMQKTYLYCRVDTTWQSLPSYQVTSNTLFPYSKFMPYGEHAPAEYRDGVAVIELEINKPTMVSVMPVRDSTVSISWSGNFLLLPGDSLELLTVPDTRITSLKCVRPRLAEVGRQDNEVAALLEDAFPYKIHPRVADGDLGKYKSDLQDFYRRQRGFLDSCRMQMTLSDAYVERTNDLFDLRLYNNLCTALERNPESEVPAGYLDSMRISERLAGDPSYVSALVDKYISRAVPEPEKHFDAVYAGIGKAPRKQRDYLTALMIGYYVEMQLPYYEEQLLEAIGKAEQSIRDTAYLSYIGRAKEFYCKRDMPFPDDALQQTMLRTYYAEQQMTLAELLGQFEGQPLFIDFWASWCSGCIMDIQQSQAAKEYLAGAGVVYIYFSIDKDVDAWRKSADKYGVTTNSYLSFDERNSPMSKFLEITTIPRYILLDKQHRIVSMDAPRPTPGDLQALKRLVGSMQ